MIRRISSLVLLALTLVASPAVAQEDELSPLSIVISPGPEANTTTWTFSGERPADGFGFFNEGASINPADPFGMWAVSPSFTDFAMPEGFTLRGDLPMTLISGSATVTRLRGDDFLSVNIIQPYFDDGAGGAGDDDRIGFFVDAELDFSNDTDDLMFLDGSIVVGGFDIAAFAEGSPFSGDSTEFSLEPNNLPLRLTVAPVVIPEPSSACLIGLVGLGIAARRRRSRV